MQIGKYIMVVGLLSLFFSFGYADDKKETKWEVKKMALIDGIKDSEKKKQIKEIYKYLEEWWYKFDADKIQAMVSQPLTLENLSETLGIKFTEEQENRLIDILVSWEDEKWLFDIDEDMINDTLKHRASTEQNYAEADKYARSAKKHWIAADKAWIAADFYGGIVKSIDNAWI